MDDTQAPPPPAPIAPAAFVERIVADPGKPPSVVVLSGYPGHSAREGCSRLYLSPDLAFWLDVPTEAVVHVLAAGGGSDPVGGAVLAWIRRDADVTGGNRWSTGA